MSGAGLTIAAILAVVLFAFFGQGASAMISGSKLTADQIAVYASNAGFTGDDLATATAIALAESGGNPSAKGDLTLGVSIGLWQINLKAHPEYQESQLYDPQANANAAYAIYAQAGFSFRPWSTYKNSAYYAYVNAGQQAIIDGGLS